MKCFYVSPRDRFELASTSKGNQQKWIVNEDGVDYYLKANTLGYEGIAEAFVAEFLSYVEGAYVDYFLCKIVEDGREYYGCYSKSMLKLNETLFSVNKLLKISGNLNQVTRIKGRDLASFVVQEVYSVCGLDITQFLQTQLNLDSIIYNEDRHLNNINLIYNRVFNSYRMAPIFDNGLSLLSDMGEYGDSCGNLDFILRKVKSKPFSSDFKKQVRYFKLNPLKVHYKEFMGNIDRYVIEDFPNSHMFNRAKEVLKFGLKRMEGVAWVQI